MATVVLKAEPSVFHTSANTPDFPSATWLINPAGFATLHGSVDPKYWKLNGTSDDIEEMTQGEKDAVDAAEAAAEVSSSKTGAKDRIDAFDVDGRALRILAVIIKDELNILRTWTRDFQAVIAASNNLADVKSGVAGLSSLTDRTNAQIVTAFKNAIDAE